METVYRLKAEDVEVRVGKGNDSVSTVPTTNSHRQLHHHLQHSDPLIKIQIANHPLYPHLLSAYIQCQKIGAPPELASLLEQIGPQSHHINALPHLRDSPQLDQFMEAYCEVLHRYKEELSKSFNEATFFLGNMESQLSNLCKGTLPNSLGHHRSGGGTLSEEELSCGEMEKEVELSNVSCGTRPSDDQKLRDMLLRKYSGHFSGLRKEFLKRRKKGKLPRDAGMALMDWWNTHNRWPYPTEEEKVKLSEVTGLDQKQINNWFINQRKRHWKPTDHDMSFGIMEGEGGPMLI